MTGVRIRPMTLDDLDSVLVLEHQIYDQPWSEQIFRDELATDNRTYLVATIDDEIVAFAGLLEVDDDAHITTVAVVERARRLRLGTRMVLALVELALGHGCRNLTLEVRISNRGAQRLYSRFGLAPVGVRKNYYRTEDALVMWAHDIDRDEYQQRLAGIREELAALERVS